MILHNGPDHNSLEVVLLSMVSTSQLVNWIQRHWDCLLWPSTLWTSALFIVAMAVKFVSGACQFWFKPPTKLLWTNRKFPPHSCDHIVSQSSNIIWTLQLTYFSIFKKDKLYKVHNCCKIIQIIQNRWACDRSCFQLSSWALSSSELFISTTCAQGAL